MRKITYLIVFAVVAMSACKKDEETPDPAPPATIDKTPLISHTWECVDMNGGSCGDVFIFNSDSSGTFDGDAMTWYFTNSQTSFHVILPLSVEHDFDIVKLTDTEFDFFHPATNNNIQCQKQ